MAIRCICLLAGFLLQVSIWPCTDGLLLRGKDANATQSKGVVTLGKVIYQPTSCNHHLSVVDNVAVSEALAHKRVAAPKASGSSTQLQALQHQKIFVVACLHNSEDIMQHWTSELVRLLLALSAAGSPTSLFVSVYESGSTDHTKDYLELLEGHLNFLGIPCKIVRGGVTRGKRERIEFLADVRNRALEPLRATTEVYDRVLWLNDIVFCADGALQMLAHALPEPQGGLGADAVCGMDYIKGDGGKCAFYDRWASKDATGRIFRNFFPIVNYGESELEVGQAFQVFSCWNGMVAFDASIFQKQRLLFRFHREDLGECAASEADLIFRDMWNIGRGRIAVSPLAASSYSDAGFKKCALRKQPIDFDTSSAISWAPAPKMSSCCPKDRGEDVINYRDCFNEDWNRFNNSVPRLNSSTSAYISLGAYAGEDANDEDWRGDDGDEDENAEMQEVPSLLKPNGEAAGDDGET